MRGEGLRAGKRKTWIAYCLVLGLSREDDNKWRTTKDFGQVVDCPADPLLTWLTISGSTMIPAEKSSHDGHDRQFELQHPLPAHWVTTTENTGKNSRGCMPSSLFTMMSMVIVTSTAITKDTENEIALGSSQAPPDDRFALRATYPHIGIV